MRPLTLFEQRPALRELVLDVRAQRVQLRLLLEGVGAVPFELARESSDLTGESADVVDGGAVGLVDEAEVVQLRADVGEVTRVQQHVQQREAIALVHRGETLAHDELGGVQFGLRDVQRAPHLREARAHLVQVGARRVVLLDRLLRFQVQAVDLGAHVGGLRAQARKVALAEFEDLDGVGEGGRRHERQGQRAERAGQGHRRGGLEREHL